MEHNWKHKTLENLEKNMWPALDSDEGSHLIITCNSLRKKNLIDFTIEDLRIMIGQSIGLKYLIPIAIEKLRLNILAEGDFYEGDLLNAIFNSEVKYWKEEEYNWKIICELFQMNESILRNFDTTWEIKKRLFASFHDFSKIN